MQNVAAIVMLALVAALGVLLYVVANVLYVAGSGSGYRPWRVPERQPLRSGDLVDPVLLRGRVVVGWPVRGGLAPAVIELDPGQVHVRGGGASAAIDRRAVRSVRTFRRSALGRGFVFDSADRRYGGIVVFPDDVEAAVAVLEAHGWPVEGPLARRSGVEAT